MEPRERHCCYLHYLQAKLGAELPYGRAAGLLQELLPGSRRSHYDDTRNRTLVLGKEIEKELCDELDRPRALMELLSKPGVVRSATDDSSRFSRGGSKGGVAAVKCLGLSAISTDHKQLALSMIRREVNCCLRYECPHKRDPLVQLYDGLRQQLDTTC